MLNPMQNFITTFEDWNTLNGTKIELITGQHRIEALKEYVRHFELDGDQLWWICDIYEDRQLISAVLRSVGGEVG
jgi:hypothetical protein